MAKNWKKFMKKDSLVVVLLCFPVLCAARDRLAIVCPHNVSTKSSTSLQASDPSGNHYNEISGSKLSPSQKAPSGEPVLYGVNDRTGGNRLGIFDSGTGERLVTLRLPFLSSTSDFESLAIGSCGSTGLQDTCIYIADVGDNKARSSPLGKTSQRNGTPYQILKIREPILGNLTDGEQIPVSSASLLPFDYGHESSPTVYADCEAVFLDHTGWGGAVGDLYFVTKWDWGEDASMMTRLFHIPASVWPPFMNGTLAPMYSPVAVGSGAAHVETTWTSADMTLDGTVIALGDYWATVLFLRCPGVSVAEALDAPYCHWWELPYSQNTKQFESFAWSPDSSKGLQISECRGSCNPPMLWTAVEYNTSTGKACPQVEWSPSPDDDGWYCRAIEDNSIKPDAWCEDWNLVRPEGDNGTDTNSGGSTTPTLSPSSATTAPSPSSATPAPSNPASPADLSVSTSGSDAPVIGPLQQLPFLLSCLFLMYHP